MPPQKILGKTLHAALGETADVYLKGESAWGPSGRRRPGIANLQVDRSSTRRALVFLSVLLTELERRGHKTNPRTVDGREGLLVSVRNVTFELRMTERWKRIPHDPTARELADQARYSIQPPKWGREPTGELHLHAQEEPRYPSTEWKDDKQGTLEQRLTAVCDALETQADAIQERRAETLRREIQALERQKEADRVAELARNLTKGAELWRQARDLQEYVVAARAALEGGNATMTDELSTWLLWAEAYAGSLDPLPVLAGGRIPEWNRYTGRLMLTAD